MCTENVCICVHCAYVGLEIPVSCANVLCPICPFQGSISNSPLIEIGQIRGKQQSPFLVVTKARSEDFVPAPFLPGKQQLLHGLPPYLQYSSESPYDSAHRGEEQAVLPIKEKLVTPSHPNPCFNSEMQLLNRINQGRST